MYTTIGKFCSIAAQTRINPGNHPLQRVALHHFTYRSKSYQLGPEDDKEFFDWRRAHNVEIGDDVWLAVRVTLMPGSKIGKGSVIGAGSIVCGEIPAGVIAIGNPARPVFRLRDSSQRI